MTRVPGGTDTGVPSIVRLMRPSVISCQSSADHDGLLLARQIGFEFAPELLYATHDWCGTRIRQHTDRFPGHVLGQIEQEVEIFCFPLPRQDPLHDLRGPGGPL